MDLSPASTSFVDPPLMTSPPPGGLDGPLATAMSTALSAALTGAGTTSTDPSSAFRWLEGSSEFKSRLGASAYDTTGYSWLLQTVFWNGSVWPDWRLSVAQVLWQQVWWVFAFFVIAFLGWQAAGRMHLRRRARSSSSSSLEMGRRSSEEATPIVAGTPMVAGTPFSVAGTPEPGVRDSPSADPRHTETQDDETQPLMVSANNEVVFGALESSDEFCKTSWQRTVGNIVWVPKEKQHRTWAGFSLVVGLGLLLSAIFFFFCWLSLTQYMGREVYIASMTELRKGLARHWPKKNWETHKLLYYRTGVEAGNLDSADVASLAGSDGAGAAAGVLLSAPPAGGHVSPAAPPAGRVGGDVSPAASNDGGGSDSGDKTPEEKMRAKVTPAELRIQADLQNTAEQVLMRGGTEVEVKRNFVWMLGSEVRGIRLSDGRWVLVGITSVLVLGGYGFWRFSLSGPQFGNFVVFVEQGKPR